MILHFGPHLEPDFCIMNLWFEVVVGGSHETRLQSFLCDARPPPPLFEIPPKHVYISTQKHQFISS